ncbi:hypothetical protein scyTo_0011154 [Scyliorhinus torazame]|uniref:Uncharacterized protein n=1 Tax=Scyliorhinus torazame TaxID=75743 RepID=A0A401NI63_SCYTO|nr:hypothetical protein [Scyliorhinus torazame]
MYCSCLPVRPLASAERNALQDNKKNIPVSSIGNSQSLVNFDIKAVKMPYTDPMANEPAKIHAKFPTDLKKAVASNMSVLSCGL